MDDSVFHGWTDPSQVVLSNGLDSHCETCHNSPAINSSLAEEDSNLHNWPNLGNATPISNVRLATLDAHTEEVGSVFYESSNGEQFYGAQRTPFIAFPNYLECNAITDRQIQNPTKRGVERVRSNGSNDSGYAGSEVRSSQSASVFAENPYLTSISNITGEPPASAIPPKKPAPIHECSFCGDRYHRQKNLQRHIHMKHLTSIGATKPPPKQASPPPANSHPSAKGPVKPTSLDSQDAANRTEPLPTTLGDTKTAQCSLAWNNLKGSTPNKACQAEPLERQNNNADIPSPLAKLAPRSTEDELKDVNSVKDVSTDELGEYGAKCGEKRKNPDDDAWLYFESPTDASDEGEDDSNCECENITSWDSFQGDALPSFLPYTCSHEIDTSSPCGDSLESGSSTSGTTSQNTPASYMSPGSRGNGLDRNARSPLGAGTASPNNGNNPILRAKGDKGAKTPDRKCLPFICWYAAAGIACTTKYVKRSTKIRYLWG